MFKDNFYYNNHLNYIDTQFPISQIINDWEKIRIKMIKNHNPLFTRNEWAYIINFCSPSNLNSIMNTVFGQKYEESSNFEYVFRPHKNIALWLPNNVSLLGPLTLILLSLTGSNLKIKIGSSGNNLMTPFIDWITSNSNNSELGNWLINKVELFSFDRNSPINSEFSKWADVRILFGGDDAAKSIDSLPHAINSKGFYFTNKSSEVIIDYENVHKVNLESLCKVIQIYGQSGCTSPKRINLANCNYENARLFKASIALAWSRIKFEKITQASASEVYLNNQLANALGYESSIIGDNSICINISRAGEQLISGNLIMNIQWGTMQEIIDSMPSNIQSIGACLSNDNLIDLCSKTSSMNIARIVPIANIHDFDITWDNKNWWKELFSVTRVMRLK